MAFWNGDNQKNDIRIRVVAELVRDTKRNFQPISFFQSEHIITGLHRADTIEDIKELARGIMIVLYFEFFGWNAAIPYMRK